MSPELTVYLIQQISSDNPEGSATPAFKTAEFPSEINFNRIATISGFTRRSKIQKPNPCEAIHMTYKFPSLTNFCLSIKCLTRAETVIWWS